MLRDSQGEVTGELRGVLGQFGAGDGLIKVCDFDILTPDSFAWVLQAGDGEYCLYAEDYVSDLAHVRRAIQEFNGGASGNFVRVRQPKIFDDLSPVRIAELYKEPADFQNMQRYVADSGVDLVFLFKFERPNRWQI